MSTLSNGENQNGREPRRKTRRTSRLGKRKNLKSDATQSENRPDINLVAGGSKDTEQDKSFDKKHGSVEPVENGGTNAFENNSKSSPTTGYFKKRGKKHRNKKPYSKVAHTGERVDGANAKKGNSSQEREIRTQELIDQHSHKKNGRGISHWFRRGKSRAGKRSALYAALDLVRIIAAC